MNFHILTCSKLRVGPLLRKDLPDDIVASLERVRRIFSAVQVLLNVEGGVERFVESLSRILQSHGGRDNQRRQVKQNLRNEDA